MIVWLASFPRSGNSFFRLVSRDLFGRQIYSIYEEKRAPVTQTDLNRMAQDSEPYLVKTHEMPPDQNPAIYLARDGRDSLVSLTWYNLTSRSEPEQDIPKSTFQRALKEEIMSKTYGGWSANVLAWVKRPEQTVVIHFENLIAAPEKVISKAFMTFGLDVDKQGDRNAPSFEELHDQNPFLYRKGKVGGWKESMNEELHDLFWKVHGKGMDALGYTR